jgi:acetyl-CoA carboxylase alpha subunit
MTVEQFILLNIKEIVGVIVMLGSLFYGFKLLRKDVQNNAKSMQELSDRIDGRFDKLEEKDDAHDRDLKRLEIVTTRHEERLSVLDDLKTMVQDIWKRAVHNKEK